MSTAEHEAFDRPLRMTAQRRAILQALRAGPGHPTAAAVHGAVRERLPRVSLGTVYRNLAQLAEAGVIRELSFPGHPSRWERRPQPHGHAVCVRCGAVIDVELPEAVRELSTLGAQATGMQVQRCTFLLEGLCAACRGATLDPA